VAESGRRGPGWAAGRTTLGADNPPEGSSES
jgi:hypothetical protein